MLVRIIKRQANELRTPESGLCCSTRSRCPNRWQKLYPTISLWRRLKCHVHVPSSIYRKTDTFTSGKLSGREAGCLDFQPEPAPRDKQSSSVQRAAPNL